MLHICLAVPNITHSQSSSQTHRQQEAFQGLGGSEEADCPTSMQIWGAPCTNIALPCLLSHFTKSCQVWALEEDFLVQAYVLSILVNTWRSLHHPVPQFPLSIITTGDSGISNLLGLWVQLRATALSRPQPGFLPGAGSRGQGEGLHPGSRWWQSKGWAEAT